MAVDNAVADDEYFSKLVPLPTSTMVLQVFWMDIEWGERHYNNNVLIQFHGPGG
jgi:hypothetical protein